MVDKNSSLKEDVTFNYMNITHVLKQEGEGFEPLWGFYFPVFNPETLSTVVTRTSPGTHAISVKQGMSLTFSHILKEKSPHLC